MDLVIPIIPEIPKIDEIKDIFNKKDQELYDEKNQIKEKQKDISPKEFSQEEVDKTWKSFFKLYCESQSVPPPPTLSSLFDFPIIKKNSNTLVINVNNIIVYKSQLNKIKPQLLPFFKKHLRQNDIRIEFESIDSIPKTEDKVHLMNNKEKFELILNRNPSMKEFLNNLDFRLLE